MVPIRPDTRCFMIASASLPWIAALDNLPTAGTLNLVTLTLTSSRKNLTRPRCPEALLKLEWAKWANRSRVTRKRVCFATVRNCSSTPASAASAYTDFMKELSARVACELLLGPRNSGAAGQLSWFYRDRSRRSFCGILERDLPQTPRQEH